MLAQRFPDDFDGIVSVVPVIHWSGQFSSFASFTDRILQVPVDLGKVCATRCEAPIEAR